MNVFVIPSWYPSAAFPSTGIFFKEQSRILALRRPDWQVGIGLWGSHEPGLWMNIHKPLSAFLKKRSKPPIRAHEHILEYNCVEFFTPAFTWSRRFRAGNIDGIIASNKKNFERHTAYFGKPDLIHAHVAYPAGVVAMELSRAISVPYVVTEHMSPFPMGAFRQDFKKVLLPPLRAANRVLAVSGALAGELARYEVKAEVVSNYIDDGFFVPDAAKRLGFKVVAIGRLEEQKGYDMLLEALKMLQLKGEGFQVKIIGGGSLERTLKKKTRQYQLENHVEWLGECSQEQVRDELQAASLLLNTSIHENQPVAILEALACGVPVLSFDWAGARELIHPGMGEVMPRDAHTLAARISALLQETPHSPDKVRQAFDERYGTDGQVKKLEEVYRQVLG